MSNQVGSRLREARLKLKMTQKQLGKELGINASAVAKYENGICFLNTKMLNIIATKYNVSIDYLVSGRGTLFYEDKDNLDFNRIKNIIDEDKELEELFSMVSSMPLARHSVLSYFQRFKLENWEIIEKGGWHPQLIDDQSNPFF